MTHIQVAHLPTEHGGSTAVFRDQLGFSYHPFECYTTICFNPVAHISDAFSPLVSSHDDSESNHTPQHRSLSYVK